MAAVVAVPVGLTLAGALVLSGLGDQPDPADGTSAADASGEIGSSVSDDSNAPETDAEDDFFAEPTATPGDAEPRGDGGPRTSTVTASSSAEEAEETGSDEGGREGGGSGGGGAGNGGGSGSGGGGGNQTTGGPRTTAVVTLVNDERAANGCGPLRVDDRLAAAAQEHSEDMAARDYMSHENPDGEGPGDRAQRHGYDSWGAENVAKGQTSAEQVMEAWMNSPGHRANILNCGLESIGVGESGNAWTQKFGWE
ncbi:CAP domain-containing protein [Nocardiopsis prasina]|uniref:CAP domain-containing protein n=1 Tax=Nocardiopsis prasina TaxID=2015 RepID=UPI000346731D